MIEKFGDDLEQKFSSFIKNELPNYELIWKSYIGNDKGQIFHVKDLDPEVDNKRIKFSQHHYTILESFICLKLIIDKSDNRIEDLVISKLEIINEIMCFHAHTGRIRDNIYNPIKHLGLCRFAGVSEDDKKNYLTRIKEFWGKRNIVIHGKKIPFAIINNSFCIPKPKEKWENTMTWSDIEHNDLISINEYFTHSFKEFIPVVNNILGDIYEKYLKKIIRENKITIDFNPPKNGAVSTGGSGSVYE